MNWTMRLLCKKRLLKWDMTEVYKIMNKRTIKC